MSIYDFVPEDFTILVDQVFFVSCADTFTGLSNVYQIAVFTFDRIDTTFVQVILTLFGVIQFAYDFTIFGERCCYS